MSGSSTSGRSGDRSRRALLLGAAAALCGGLSRVDAQVSGAPGCTAEAPLPARFRLDYVAEASRGLFSLDGENELVFETSGTRYTLQSATRSLLFTAEQSSTGELRFGPQGALLVPHAYRERSGRRTPRNTRFDWASQRVTFSANQDGTTTTQPRLQDRLSLLLQAGQQLRLQQGQGAVELPVAGTRHVSTYRFEPRGKMALELPAGRFDAHRLERPLTDDQDGLEVWLVPELCWLPVRLRFTDDRGVVIQNQLRAARFD